MNKIQLGLRDLGFSDNEIKVYFALTKLGEARASEVAKKAGLERTTTISILERLAGEALITTHKYQGVQYFWIESPKVIQSVFENKARIAEGLSGFLSDLYRTEANFPFAQSFDTKESVKKFTEKLLSGAEINSIIYTIDSPHLGNYAKIFTDDYWSVIVEQKKKRKTKTLTLIPFGTESYVSQDKTGKQNIEIRMMPEGIDFSASVWFVDDLMILFSGKPPFIVSVKHMAIVSSMKSLYDFLWKISKPL